jgi:hypothetical protein
MVFGTSAIETYMKIGFYAPSGNYIVTVGRTILVLSSTPSLATSYLGQSPSRASSPDQTQASSCKTKVVPAATQEPPPSVPIHNPKVASLPSAPADCPREKELTPDLDGEMTA